jgi:2-keto-myo-inositol isomerase
MKLQWAFNSATVMNLGWDDEFKLWRRYKWKHVELWFDKIKACMEAGRTCAELGAQMHDAGIAPVGMAPAVVWTETEKHDSYDEHAQLVERMDVALAMGVPMLTLVVLGARDRNLAREYDRLVEKLRNVAMMAEGRGLRLALEFIGGLPVNGTMGTCMDLVTRVDRPSLGMLLDMCHYYTSASHIEELDRLEKGKLFLVHVDDSRDLPMEDLHNEQRCWPGEGRIDVPGLITEIRKRAKFKGPWSVELYDKDVWQMDPVEVFKKTAAAVRKVEKAMGK